MCFPKFGSFLPLQVQRSPGFKGFTHVFRTCRSAGPILIRAYGRRWILEARGVRISVSVSLSALPMWALALFAAVVAGQECVIQDGTG